MGFAVKAETHEGNSFTLRVFDIETVAMRHRNEAARHRCDAKNLLWKRVWIEEVADKPDETAPGVLPPRPWDWIASHRPDKSGKFNAYLVAADGRKIACIWGRGNEREVIADFIMTACNNAKVPA